MNIVVFWSVSTHQPSKIKQYNNHKNNNNSSYGFRTIMTTYSMNILSTPRKMIKVREVLYGKDYLSNPNEFILSVELQSATFPVAVSLVEIRFSFLWHLVGVLMTFRASFHILWKQIYKKVINSCFKLNKIYQFSFRGLTTKLKLEQQISISMLSAQSLKITDFYQKLDCNLPSSFLSFQLHCCEQYSKRCHSLAL